MSDQSSAIDPDLLELFESIFAGREAQGGFDEGLWSDLQEAGIAKLTGSGEYGSGAGLPEAAELLRVAAFHGISLPIAENDLLAGWLAERAGLDDTPEIRTSAIVGADGVANDVPWARHATSALLLQQHDGNWRMQEVDTTAGSLRQSANIAGEPRDVVAAEDGGVWVPVGDDVVAEWELRGALARSVQIAGALQRAVALAIEYSKERTQFGRAIAAFQAVQHRVADIASEAALALAAADNAVLTAAEADAWDDPQLVFDIAVAKSVTSAAVATVTRGAHQILGAIGTTVEHPLHTLTLPAHAWSLEFGTASQWNRRILELTASPSRHARPWELISRLV